MELLAGVPVVPAPGEGEFVTPTGAALMVSLCHSFGDPPPMVVEKVGYGAGQRDIPQVPNLLRVFLGEVAEPTARFQSDEVVALEANLDDMNPELFAEAFAQLAEAGALDFFVTPVVMKKGRPGHLLTVLAPPDKVEQVAAAVFEHTTTFGLRYSRRSRYILRRTFESVDTVYGRIPVKVAWHAGEPIQFSPEHDACAAAARRHRVPLKQVYAASLAALEHLLRERRLGHLGGG